MPSSQGDINFSTHTLSRYEKNLENFAEVRKSENLHKTTCSRDLKILNLLPAVIAT